MDMKVLHSRFSDKDSPSVEGQIRWLQKNNFPQHQIEQAMITVYSELERGKIPKRWTNGTEVKYLSSDSNYLSAEWFSRPISGGAELDQYLLEIAKRIRTEELTTLIRKMEQFEINMRKKWEAEQKQRKPWYKRIF